jgi:DNA-binding transcriptional LysR family regulator
MQGFDLEQLRTLAAVVDAGSLTAAAPRVFLSQSSVSEQIRKLEERAGQSLLTRSKAGVSPTEAGVRLLGYARRILSLSDEAFRDLHGETLQGELRLAVTDYFRPGDLTRLLGRLGESYPQVRLHVTILKSDDLRAAYARGDFDVGVAMNIAGVSAAQPRASVIRRESLVWLGAAGMRLVRGEPVRLLALPDTCSLHQFTVALLRRRRVPYALAQVASVGAGCGAGRGLPQRIGHQRRRGTAGHPPRAAGAAACRLRVLARSQGRNGVRDPGPGAAGHPSGVSPARGGAGFASRLPWMRHLPQPHRNGCAIPVSMTRRRSFRAPCSLPLP